MTEGQRFHSICCLACLCVAIILMGGVGCGSSPTEQVTAEVDEEFERMNRVARTAFDHGRFRQAADLYNQALERAYVLDDVDAIVDSQYNLAVCLVRLHDYDQALEQISQSRAELTRAGRRIPVDILLLEATTVYRMGKLDDAWLLTDTIILGPSRPSEAIQSKTHFMRGLIAAEWDDINQLRQEIVSLGKPSAVGLRADREELVGRLAMAQSNWNEATEAFDKTAEYRRDDFDYSEMVNALALAAWACEQAGKLSEASKRYLRAGRSAARQGESREALNWLNRAEKLAREAGDESSAKEARSYRKWIEAP
ncbi:MAG: tetratricopeptide repeat protein [Desulfobacteraceae bacterium]|nr:tetratricopeptide repeat protein [Desulfobacteraceae bacterium]